MKQQAKSSFLTAIAFGEGGSRISSFFAVKNELATQALPLFFIVSCSLLDCVANDP
jgi:hypothetical protein